MFALPGSLPWLFLLVYLARGQILDNATAPDASGREPGDVYGAVDGSSIRRNEEEKESKTAAPPEPGRGGTPDAPDPPGTNATAPGPGEPEPTPPADSSRNRNQRRRPTYQTMSLPSASEIPVMSQERRNSYLSIAERRKYYNRTRVQTRKPETNDVDLERRESPARAAASTAETPHLNEIHVVKKPLAKDSEGRPVTEEGSETNDQRAPAAAATEAQPKPQSTRKSVIQSQYQFGQKLNLRKPVARAQDGQKERSRLEAVVENSTNNLGRNYPTQSTKLVRVDRPPWPTTTVPGTDGPHSQNVTADAADAASPSGGSSRPLPLSHDNSTGVFGSTNSTELFSSDATTETASFDFSASSTSHERNGKLSNQGATDAVTPPQSTTPLVRVIPKESAVSPATRGFPNEATPGRKVSGGDAEGRSPLPVETWSSTEEYPLTIELNENNKRVLSEMFQTSTASRPREPEKESPTTRSPGTSESDSGASPASTTATPPATTAATTTTEGIRAAPPEDPQEDHKAQGTRYSTKFFIAPDVNRSQVIKVVEEDDEDGEDVVGVRGRSAGVAIYVLSAFGLVPLMLALIFAAKFVIQRQQRQYECESDAKSDISAIESQSREGRKKKGSTDLKKSPSNVTTTTLVTTTRLPRVHHWENCDKQGSRNWEFPRSKLKLKTILGQGNFGQVWKAEAEDMAGHEGGSRLVAVKTVKEGATEKEHAEFIKELEIMQQIGSHPNIVTLLGCCTDQEPYYLIMEYVKYGKLLTYLREHRVNENYYNFSNNSDALTSRDLTVFAYCVSRGMEYLASRGIIHRDLAARNVLVDHTKLCKIADFGMSRSVRDFDDGQVYEERQHKGALPIRWMAPESLVYSVFTYKSDVWSFGILMWEIVTLGSTPYPNMGAREVMRKVRDGYRLERPSHCKPEFFRLISHCWAHDPNKRPDFSELRHELGNLLDNPTKDGSYVDLDRFAISNSLHASGKSNDLRLLERSDFKSLKRLGDWNPEDWPEDPRKSSKLKRGRNNGKGTVTLTGQGSFTVNSRILEKEFKMI